MMKSFGSTERVKYDSKEFYERNVYNIDEKIEPFHENIIDEINLDKIFNHGCESMHELPDSSVHLTVTSPPYNVGKEYDDDMTFNAYMEFLNNVWKELYRVTCTGGRVCINVAGIGRKPYIPLQSFITTNMLNIGFLMRGEIIWNKGASAGSSCAWGSWMSASNPVLRDMHEYVLVFCKDDFKRKSNNYSTITKDDFMMFTKSIWNINTESARKIGHPAPFPVELPARLINLYTFKGDVVLDPFMGSGSTAVSAKKLGRRYVGYEISPDYIRTSEKRLKNI